MRSVISASKRTDIPAFYLKWFADRVHSGSVDVPNPLFRNSVRHVSLLPADVGGIVFWSKNYAVFERMRYAFDPYELFFQFTINPPNTLLEPDVIDTAEAVRQMTFLARAYGAERIAWRYDPIVCWRRNNHDETNYDLGWFERMCGAMEDIGITRCFTSFADLYARFRMRVARTYPEVTLTDPPDEQKRAWATSLLACASAHHIQLAACAEEAIEGVCAGGSVLGRGACVDGRLLNTLLGASHGSGVSIAAASDRKVASRAACGCTAMVDIGDYVTHECGYACLYCYANPNHRRFIKLR